MNNVSRLLLDLAVSNETSMKSKRTWSRLVVKGIVEFTIYRMRSELKEGRREVARHHG